MSERFHVQFDFEPTRLRAARKEVQAEHLTTAQLGDYEPAAPHELFAKIQRAEQEEALAELAWELSNRELRFAVRQIGAWSDLRDAIAVMAKERPRAEFVGLLWQVWERYPDDSDITALLLNLTVTLGPEEAFSGAFRTAIPEWLGMGEPRRGIVAWMASDDVAWDQVASVPDTPFREGTPLQRSLFTATMMYGVSRQLGQFTVEDFTDGWSSLGPEDRMVACANYLSAIPASQWSATLLESIRDAYRMPQAEGAVTRFWNMVSADGVAGFRRHFIERDLEKAFTGTDDRRRYWKRWAGQIVEVELGTAGDTKWALINFGGFSVLEFFAVNNAAFFYAKADVRRLHLRRARSPGELKIKIEGPLPGYTDNRLLHTPMWESRANGMLKAWSKKFG